MSDKSIVYWAPPFEIPSLINSRKNMVTNNLVKTRIILDKILDNIKVNDKVAIKVHVGEAYNTRYLRHDYIREVVKAIKAKGAKPTLIETQGMGLNMHCVEISDDYSVGIGCRKNPEEHYKVAKQHGYDESIVGAPLEFVDGTDGLNGRIVKIDGLQLKEISVAADLFKFDKIVVVSHFKGHGQAAFGGAIKQIGIGCVTKHNKFLAHNESYPTIKKRKCDFTKCNKECINSCPVNTIKIEEDSALIGKSCFGCLECLRACPVKRAIEKPKFNEVETFIERVMDNILAVLTAFGQDNIRYLSVAVDVTSQCDCVTNSSMPVVPDLGIFGSSDPVAIDKACVDAETNAPGLPIMNKEGEWTVPIPPGVEKFRAMNAMIDTDSVFAAALKNKIGSIEYELINI